MAYGFDLFGWYFGEAPDNAPRSTLLAPPSPYTGQEVGHHRAMWTGDAWALQPYAQPPELMPAIDPVPAAVTMRQARLALLAQGRLGAVETAINAMSEPERSAARIAWDHSSTVERRNPLVLALMPVLELSEQEIDELFRAAALL